MKKFISFCVALLLLVSTEKISAQTYAQVTQLAPGVQVVNGVTVTVSSAGFITTYPSGYCGMTNGPNPLPWIGQSGTSSYHYAFSQPVWGIRVRQLSLNVGENIQLNTNGTMYFLQPSMAQSYTNTCNEPFGYVNAGLFMPPSPYGQGEIEITPGSINDFDVICNTGNSGVVFTVEIIFPDVAASNNGPICAGDMLILTGTATNTGLTYNWTGPNGFTSNQQSDTIFNASTLNGGMYYLNATDGLNSWIDSTLVVVNPVPVISNSTFTHPGPCNATDGTITLSGLFPNTAFTVDYLKDGVPVTANGNSDGTGTLIIPNLPSGLYTMITVTVGGCTSNPVGPITLINAPLVAPTVGSNSPVCEEGVISLTAVSYPGATYNWTGPNTFSSTQQNPNITPAQLVEAGTYTVTSSINGCTTPPASVNVVVVPLPAPPLTQNLNYCQDDIVPPLTAQGINLLWYDVATGGTGLQIFTPPTNTAGTTTYYVTQTVNGCESHRSPLEVKINPIIVLDLTASQPVVCINDPVVVTNNTTPPPGSVYTWEFSGGNVQGGTDNDPRTISWNTYGDKTVSLMVTDGICTTNDAVNILVDTPMHPFFDIYGHACINEEIELPMADYTGHNPPVYNWNFDGGTIIRGDELGAYWLSWSTDGVKTITLDIPGICPEHFEDQVAVHTPPVAQIASVTPNPVCEGVPVTLVATQNPGISAYKWRELDYFGFNNSPVQEAIIKESGWVTLEVLDDYGCSTQDKVYVEVQPCCQIFIPSVFSPNGDGKNDVFRPRTAGFQHFTTFQIMNRWGQVIFESKNQSNGWDGTFKGVTQDPGTYTYFLQYSCNGTMTDKMGTVMLVK